jgi:hypothetical protein
MEQPDVRPIGTIWTLRLDPSDRLFRPGGPGRFQRLTAAALDVLSGCRRERGSSGRISAALYARLLVLCGLDGGAFSGLRLGQLSMRSTWANSISP